MNFRTFLKEELVPYKASSLIKTGQTKFRYKIQFENGTGITIILFYTHENSMAYDSVIFKLSFMDDDFYGDFEKNTNKNMQYSIVHAIFDSIKNNKQLKDEIDGIAFQGTDPRRQRFYEYFLKKGKIPYKRNGNDFIIFLKDI